MNINMNQVLVLRTGYSCLDPLSHTYKANCTISLVRSNGLNIIVDTGLPQDKDFLLDSIQRNNLTPNDIHYVVATHGHTDHVGNLNLFPNATLVVGNEICKGDMYIENNLTSGCAFKITEDIEIIPTPGHTCHDVSLIVKNTPDGVVALAGDVFEKREDLDNPALWKDVSYNPERQLESRVKLVQLSNRIIPGHGAPFSVDAEVRCKVEQK